MSTSPKHRCSFCAKTQDKVVMLVAGPAVFICDECVDICAVLVAKQRATPNDQLDEIRKLGT